MKYLILLATVFLSGCVTTSGNYTVTATRADGTFIPNAILAQGSGIYSARNAFCKAHPGATVKITDNETKEEHLSESPYKCK
ncbi:hypothetical protein GGR61_003182 [Xanthomonas arboricola]|nr:hypothetical protein [Xanthomonas sp. 3058]